MVVTTTSVTVAPGGRVRKLYKCSSCDKVFQRSEHCIRHERAHTQERPFACQFCHKTYARKDLVKRHERTIHAQQYEALQVAPDVVSLASSANSDAATAAAAAVTVDEQTKDDNQNLPQDDLALTLDAQHAHELPIDPNLYSQHYMYNLPSPLPTEEIVPHPYPPSNARDMFPDRLFFLDDVAADEDGQRSHKRPRLDTSTPVSYAPQTSSEPFDVSLLADLFSMDDACPMPNLAFTPLSSHSMASEEQTRLPQGSDETTTETLRNNQNPILQNSRTLFRQLPRVLQEKSNSPPRFEIDQSTYQSICSDVMDRMAGEGYQQFLPTIQELRRFLVGYIDCFHRHLPIIHLPSLVLSDAPSPLILALSAIGALYRLDRRRAALSYHLAFKLLRKFELQRSPTQVMTPLDLWAVQTRLLLTFYALFTGDAALIALEYQRLGFYLIDYRLRRTLISRLVVPPSQLTWSDYVQRESHKRLLCAILVMSNLAMVVYDATPGFLNPEDLDFELPDAEHVWNAKTEEEWRRLWEVQDKQHSKSLRAVLTDFISDDYNEGASTYDQSEQTYHLTTFGGLMLMHAVCIHMWTSLQLTRAVGLYSNVGVVGNLRLRSMILSNCVSTLSRCQKSLLRNDKEGNPTEPPWDASEGPLLFNCQAVLRIAYTRLFLPEIPFPRMIMITGSEEDVDEAAAAYVTSPLERSDFYTKAAVIASQGFLTPVRIGHLLVRKTAAFGWSVEHAVAGWDSALFLTKWIHTIEIESSILPPTTEEQAILSELKESLSEIDYAYTEHTSLASAVAGAWSCFLTDVWVWGITPKMGSALERVAASYQKDFNRLCGDK